MRAVAALACVLACACSRDAAPQDVAATGSAAREAGSAAASNTARADYIGPEACGECHADEYARWSQSLHRVMNARASDPGAVIGDFATRVAYDGGEAVFARDGEAYTMTLRRGGSDVRYRVTRTIGRRGLQEYVGIEDGHTDEVRLPFGWWPRAGGWAAQSSFDPWLDASFDAFAPVREPWAERCPWCHSTYPFDQRIARAAASGAGHGLEQLVAQPATTPTVDAARLAVDEQVTTGISCESCHLGGRAHAAGAAIDFLPHVGHTNLPATFAAQRTDARVVNRVCAQCHSGPSPRLADGTALRNSSEAIDLAASPCKGIKCTDCHDPHRADSRTEDSRALAACTHCHTELADATAARAHAGTGHAAGAATCLDCHMPRIVMGIDRFVRTHRISSPTNPQLLAKHAPNACNTCHLDRSLAWTADVLAREWNVPIHLADDRNLGPLWLTSSSPTLRVFAAHAYARSPLGRAALPSIEHGLRDPVPFVRAWTQLALDQLGVISARPSARDFLPR